MRARAGRGPNPDPPSLDPRPPVGCQPMHQPGTTVRGHCPRAGAREKRQPGRKGAGRAARTTRRALTLPLLPKAFDALAGGRGGAAVGAGPASSNALRRSRSRGPDWGLRRAARPAPQQLPPPPISPFGRRLPRRRGGGVGRSSVAFHGHAEPARSHPQQPLLPPEPAPQRRIPCRLLRGSTAQAEAHPPPAASSVAPMLSKPIQIG